MTLTRVLVGGRDVVRFGRDISKWFRDHPDAERFLTGLRYETDTLLEAARGAGLSPTACRVRVSQA